MRRALALAALLAGCGASTAEMRQARDAMYQTDRATLWREVVAEMREQFPSTGLAVEDETKGVVESKWRTVEAMQEANDAEQIMAGGDRKPARTVFRALVRIEEGGPPWVLYVDGQAGMYRPEYSAMQPFRHGADDEPQWVQGKIDSLRLALYQRLKAYAVKMPTAAPTAPPSGGASATAPGAGGP